jgi:hypothetical protein
MRHDTVSGHAVKINVWSNVPNAWHAEVICVLPGCTTSFTTKGFQHKDNLAVSEVKKHLRDHIRKVPHNKP